MRILRFDAQENYTHSDAFMMANGDFRRPIDLIFGPDGLMYLLEYGSIYGVNNRDASLVRIEYNRGNRAPIAQASVIDRAGTEQMSRTKFLTSETKNMPFIKEFAGALPLTVPFSSRGTRDLDDDDELTYQWLFDGQTVGSAEPNPAYTYTHPGIYQATLRVTDKAGFVGMDTVTIKVGNERPVVAINTANNKSFYWGGKPFEYVVTASDREEGTNCVVTMTSEYNPEPDASVTELRARPPMVQGEQPNPLNYPAIAASDCRACHTLDQISVGPSFTAVARKYRGQSDAIAVLAKKIISGGAGNWGQVPMSAHPQISTSETTEMVKRILVLAETNRGPTVLPLTGKISLDEQKPDEPRGVYIVRATAIDKGANGLGPLTASETIVLRSALVRTIDADAYVGFARFRDNLSPADHKSYVLLKDIDLTGITKWVYEYSAQDKDGEVEVRMDSFAGPVIGRTAFKATGGWDKFVSLDAPLLAPVTGRHDVFFIMMKRDRPNDKLINLRSIQFAQ